MVGARLEKYHDYFVSYQDIRNVFDEEDISKIYFDMSDLDNNVIGDIIAEVLGGVKEFHAAVLVSHLRSQECLLLQVLQKTVRRRKIKFRDKSTAFHITFVMTLFDRSVDLAQFRGSTNYPLYPTLPCLLGLDEE